jgi:hypothetical protein
VGELDAAGETVNRGLALLAIGVTALLSSAHVGSPDTWFEGMAGPYPVRVVIRAPGVVPGLSEITIRVSGGGVHRVTATPVIWNTGAGGIPPADEAKPVPGDPELYSVQLWFMRASSYSVHVTVEGDQGTGTVQVPFQAVATRHLPLNRPLQIVLSVAGLILFAGAVTLIGAATRESVLPPGEEPNRRRKILSVVAMVASAIVLALGVIGGRAWWNAVEAEYRQEMYRPFAAKATVAWSEAGSSLEFEILDSVWRARGWTPLIPDHGKLMHLFLVRDSLGEGWAHLHPVALDSNRFETRIPALPAGHYRIYADIVHESGFAQTLVAVVNLHGEAAPRGWKPSDADDSWLLERADEAVGAGGAVKLPDGSTMTWEASSTKVDPKVDAGLRFKVTAPDGKPARLEPYMGMAGHAIIERSDGSVFAHLHPMGTAAMASQLAFEVRQPQDTAIGVVSKKLAAEPDLMSSAMMHEGEPGVVEFPYAFPRDGAYRVWVQVKVAGRVQTGMFRLEVPE